MKLLGEFVYLGVKIDKDCGCRKEVKNYVAQERERSEKDGKSLKREKSIDAERGLYGEC